MRPFSFIHCADLHLDSPFEGLHSVDPAIAQSLRDATFQSFDNVVSLAIREKVSFLIISGDVYDGADRSLRAQWRFVESLKRAVGAGVRCFVAHGNHDPLSGWEAGLSLPEGADRFRGDSIQRFKVRRDGELQAVLYGISYPVREVGTNLATGFRRDVDAPFAIGVLHCNVGRDTNHDNYAPCTMNDLQARRMDYWALGHVHNRNVLADQTPCVVYPGNTQGRNPKELGPRGCYLVRVDRAGSISPMFLPTDAVRWFTEEVDISTVESVDDLKQDLIDMREDVRGRAEDRPAVLRLRLVGRGDLHTKIRLWDTEHEIAVPLRDGEAGRRDFVWVDSVQTATRSPIDIPQRREFTDFIGDFLRSAEDLRTQPNALETLREMLTKKREHRIISSLIADFSEADLRSILDEAEALGLDHLLEEENSNANLRSTH